MVEWPSLTRYPTVRPPLWGTSRAVTRNEPTATPSSLKASGGNTSNVQLPRRFRGRMGKSGGDIIRASTLSASAPSSCGGRRSVTCGVGVVAALEERQTLNVVPVQVGQEDGAGERPLVEQGRNPADAGSRIEQERRWRLARCGRVAIG